MEPRAKCGPTVEKLHGPLRYVALKRIRDVGPDTEGQGHVGLFVVCWLLNIPATCKCISGTELLRQLYLLPY